MKPVLFSLRGETSGRKKFFLQNEPNSSFRINIIGGFALGSIGFDRLKKGIIYLSAEARSSPAFLWFVDVPDFRGLQ